MVNAGIWNLIRIVASSRALLAATLSPVSERHR
jgi:hypothetical protein